MSALSTLLRENGVKAFRRAALRRAALRVAALRGRAVALLYHRVTPQGPATHEVVPSLPSGLFRRQLQALGDIGDIVPLAALLEEPESRRRPRFAVTFDDDEPCHVWHALPILRELGVHATFFLSGRSLRGLPPYWWQSLEQLIAERGAERTRQLLGLAGATAAGLAEECEGSAVAERLPHLARGPDTLSLGSDGIRALAAAEMTIGFHTLRHPVLTRLSDEELEAALRDGRDELAALVGRPVELLAYPHGRADERVAARARAAGYLAAFASGGRPLHRRSHRFLLGRWEPGPLEVDELLASLALRLNRPAGLLAAA